MTDRTAPPITEQLREHARQNPGTWLYIVDPGYSDDEGEVPPEGVVGAYRIDERGEIDEDFQFNDGYVPSPLATDRPEPTNALEAALERISTGQAPEAELTAAVLAGEVLLYSPDPEERSVYAAEMSDGSQLVPACTSVSRLPADWPGYRRVAGRDLPEVLQGLDLGLNLDDAVQAVIPYGVLLRAATS